MTTILAVHGTFATEADWAKPGSPLRSVFETTLGEIDDPADFKPIPWTGRNLIEQRLVGAKLIEKEVLEVRKNKPGERIILVGHSHGGSAAAYFLEQHDRERENIYGAVFLSTPFIAFRPKDDLGHRVKTYCYVGLFAFQIGVLFAVKYLAEWLGFASPGIYFLLMFNFLFGLFLLQSYRTFGFFDGLIDRQREAVAKAVCNRDSCRLPNRRYLFLRFSGDEASMGLSFAQSVTFALNWMLEFFYEHALRWAYRARHHRMIGTEVLELGALLLISAWLISCPFMVGYNLHFDEVRRLADADRQHQIMKLSVDIDAEGIKLQNLEELILADEQDAAANLSSPVPVKRNARSGLPSNATEEGSGTRNVRSGLPPNTGLEERLVRNRERFARVSQNIVELQARRESVRGDYHDEYAKFYFVRTSQWIAAIVLYGLFLLGGASLLTYLCLRAFGSTDLTALLYLEGSVEVVPHGIHPVVHLDWKDTAIKRRNLRHSAVYSSPVALNAIADWLDANLAIQSYNSS